MWEQLIQAINLRNTKMVKELIQKDVLAVYKEKAELPLHLAAFKGSEEIVRLLLDKEPDLIKIQDAKGNTALHLAAQEGRDGVVALLITADEKLLDVVNSDKHTALHLAALSGSSEGVIKLLINKMKPEAVKTPDNEGNTALALASETGHDKVVELLRKVSTDSTTNTSKGGVINEAELGSENEEEFDEDKKGEPKSSHEVSLSGTIEIDRDALLKEIESYEFSPDDFFASEAFTLDEKLVEAVKTNRIDLVKSLVAQQADVNTKNFDTPILHLAIKQGNIEIVEFLMQQKNIDTNCVSDNVLRYTILQTALVYIEDKEKQKEMLSTLLKAEYREQVNSMINTENANHQTVLHYANDVELVKMLIASKADVNVESPLSILAHKGNLDVVKVLIEYKAQIDDSAFISATNGLIHGNNDNCRAVLDFLYEQVSRDPEQWTAVHRTLQQTFGKEDEYYRMPEVYSSMILGNTAENEQLDA